MNEETKNRIVEEWRKKFDCHLAELNIPWALRQQMEEFAPSIVSSELAKERDLIRGEIKETITEVSKVTGDGFITKDMQNFGLICLKDVLSLPSLNYQNKEEKSV